MRQHEPQAMAVIEVLPVHVGQAQGKRKKIRRNKVLRPDRDGETTW